MAFIDDLKRLLGINTQPKNDPLANYLSKNNVSISGSDYTKAGFADPTKQSNTSGYTAAPSAQASKGLSIIGNQQSPLQQSGMKVNLPQSYGPQDLIAQQEKARSQDISRGGFVWSSKEDYDMDRRKAQQLGYSSPEAMRAGEQRKGVDTFRNSQSTQPFDFTKFLSSLNPVKQVSAAELPSELPEPEQNIPNSALSANPRAEDTAALFRGINIFDQSQSFADRLKNIVSGIAGKTGQVFNMPDANISEWIRGMGSGDKAVLGAQSYEGSNANQPRQSFADPKQLNSYLQSTGTPNIGTESYGGPTNYKGSEDDLYNSEDVGGEWILLGENLDKNRQEIENRIAAGEISGKQGILEREQYQIELLKPYYEQLNAMAMSGIPVIEANAQKQISRLNENLAKYKESANPIRANVENTYGTATRSAVENSQRAKTNLRNVYSSMGSAESSQFLDRLGDIEKETGRTTGQYDLEKGQQLDRINTGILDQETYTNQQIVDVEDETKQLIKSVYDQTNLNNLEKTQKIGDIIASAQDAITALQEGNRETLTNLDLLDRQALINKDSLLTQGQIDQNSILQQSQLLDQNLQSAIPYIPPEVDSVIRGFLAAPQSGGSKYFQLQTLKGQYPDLADFLDQVMGGQITSQSYNAQAGGQGAGNYNLGF